MKKRRLGKTDLEVSELGLGGLFVSKVGGDYAQAKAAIDRAIELDVNYIDTAPGYLNSEEVLGRALHGVKAPLILSTKLGGWPRPFKPQDKNCLVRSVKRSLRLLKRDYIDILMIHEPDRPRQYDWWTDWERFTGPVLEVMADLKRQGVIGYTGVGGTTAYELARIIRTGNFDVVLTAFNYSLLWREAEHEVLPAAKKLGMGIVIGSPLQQGALARRYDAEIEHGAPWLSRPRREQYRALYRFLDEIDMQLAELAIRFCLSNPDVSSVLMGARSRQEVELNVAAARRGPLPKTILKRLDAISAMVPFRPFEEPFGLPFAWPGYRGPGMAGR